MTTSHSSQANKNDAINAHDEARQRNARSARSTHDAMIAALSKNKRILILSSQTGGGHTSAANALKSALKSNHIFDDRPRLVHIENVLESSTWVNHQFAKLYNVLLCNGQQYMHLYYAMINYLKIPHRDWILEPMRAYARRLLIRHRPHCIVSVHPMMQGFAAMMQQMAHEEGFGKLPIYTVVTDPCFGFWPGWVHPEVTRYYTATPDATQQLRDFGVPIAKIRCLGLPVAETHHRISALERQQLKQEMFGDEAYRLTLFFNAGWHGGGNIEPLLRELLRSLTPEQIGRLNLVFQAGSNKKQYARMRSFAKQNPDLSFVVVDSQTPMHQLYAIADVMMSKCGALTIFEALNNGLPLFVDALTPPMPQEAGTSIFIEDIRAGKRIASHAQLLEAVTSLLSHPQQLQNYQLNALEYATPTAARDIASNIMTCTWPESVNTITPEDILQDSH